MNIPRALFVFIAASALTAHAANAADNAPMDMHNMAGMAGMAGMSDGKQAPVARDSSGTSWQPDSVPMMGVMTKVHDWSLMAEGNMTLIADNQGGPRGARQTFATSMGMLMASREITDKDQAGLRAMLSLDPSIGAAGYPLLFATGETADGRTPLIDRQHPHELIMELSGSWRHELAQGTALSVYAGLPGEPALGPPTFMHRISGMDNPEAPIGHHWFDSTHITFGVVTAGLSFPTWKIEASSFKGREPDERRWDLESPKLDSWSARFSWNPARDLSMQLSTGYLHSPEQLEPNRNEQRTTASATWNVALGTRASWASTAAWSVKNEQPGPLLQGYLVETAFRFGPHEVFARAEHEQENELLNDVAHASAIYGVSKLSVGYQHESRLTRSLFLDVGGLVSAYDYPAQVRTAYGPEGVKSFMLYLRLRFGS